MKRQSVPFLLIGLVACSSSGGDNDAVMDSVVVDVADAVEQFDIISDSEGEDVGRDACDAFAEVATDVSDPGSDAESDDVVDVVESPWFEMLAARGQKVSEIFGVASHMETSEEGDVETEYEFDQYLAIGGARARRGFRWSNVEPVEGEWHFEETNGAVTRSAQHGVKLMPVVYYGNDWAEEDPEAYGTLDVSKYANYAAMMARQYCDDVKEYELWNEQNTTRFWHIPPDPAKYAEMVVASSIGIKSECPDAKVVYGGMTSYDDVDMFDTWNFLRRSLEARPDLCEYMDGVALHPYTFFQFDSPEYDEIDIEYSKRGQTSQTDLARQILSDAGCDEKDIYYTELGWPTYDLSREQVANYAVRSLLLAARDGVEGWYWYTFYDDAPDGSGIRPHENHFGLFEYPGTAGGQPDPKPSWIALLNLLEMVGPGRYAGEVSRMLGLPDDVYVLAFVSDEDDLILAMWDGRSQPDVVFGVTAEGGPTTSFDVEIPMPGWVQTTALYDQSATEIESPGAGPSVSIHLTPEIKYLAIRRNPVE